MSQQTEYRLLTLGDMIPMVLAGPVLHAIGKAVEKAGYDCYFKEETGSGVVWVRRRPPQPRKRRAS